MSEQSSVNELGAELRQLVAQLDRRYRSQRPSGELGGAALSILSRLQKIGPQTITELSTHAGVTVGSMSQPVSRLAELGYVVRTPDAHDGRKFLLSATPPGREVAATVRARLENWFDQQLTELEASERAQLNAVLPILRKLSQSE